MINQADGTYTELPHPGERVDCGDAFYRVNKKAVLLLCGKVPAYRDLHRGQAGNDVRQLNRNLHRLGYDAKAGVEIDPDDSDFTAQTQVALKVLQDDKRLLPESLALLMRSSCPSRQGSPRCPPSSVFPPNRVRRSCKPRPTRRRCRWTSSRRSRTR